MPTDEDDDNQPPFISGKPTLRIDPSTLLRYEEDVQSLTRILAFTGNSTGSAEILSDMMILRLLMGEAQKPSHKVQEAMANILVAKAAALEMLSFVTRRSSLNIVPPENWRTLIRDLKQTSPRGLHAMKVGLIEETKSSLARLSSRIASKADWTNFCEVVALLSELPWETE